MGPIRLAACCSLLALLAHTGCAPSAELIFSVEGDFPRGELLRVHVATIDGVLPNDFVLPQDERGLKLPGTIAIMVAGTDAEVGLLLQLETREGEVLATGRSSGCVSAARDGKGPFAIELKTARDAWLPAFVNSCACGRQAEGGEMCVWRQDGEDDPDGGDRDAGVPTGRDGGRPPSPQADAAPPRARDAMPIAPPPSTDLGGFESLADWTCAEATLSLDTRMPRQGQAALAFEAMPGRPLVIESRPFATGALGAATGSLRLDVFVAKAQDHGASIQAVFHCPEVGIFDLYLTWQPLQPLMGNAWSSLSFTVPPDAVSRLRMPANSCRLRLHHQGDGAFRYDNLVFVP